MKGGIFKVIWPDGIQYQTTVICTLGERDGDNYLAARSLQWHLWVCPLPCLAIVFGEDQ